MANKIWIDKPKKVGNYWQIRFRNSEDGYKPRYKTFSCDDYSERFVKDKVKDLKAEARLGKFDPWSEDKSQDPNLILSDAIALFLSSYKSRVASSTFENTKLCLELFADEYGEHIKVKSIIGADIDKFIDGHTDKISSIRIYQSRFNQLFKFLQDNNIIEELPKLRRIHKQKSKSEAPEILNEDQLLELYEKALNSYVNKTKKRVDIEAWKIYFYTGLRTEELTYMKACDVDLETSRAKVGYNRSTKTNSKRTIWIPEECHESFRYLMKGLDEDDFLIDHSRSINIKKMASCYRLFKKVLKDVFPEKDMPLYNLRHSAGCWMLEQGLSIKFVQEQLGHKQLGQVLTYARLTETGFDKELERIGR